MKRDYCDESDETNQKVLKFIREHRAEAQEVAAELGVPVENLLGLSATESGYGTSRIAKKANNFFGLHAGAPGSSGTFKISKNVKVAKFNSYNESAASFASKFGDLVRGKKEPKDFVEALIPKFNPANEAKGGNPNFLKDTIGGIEAIVNRLSCKQLSAQKCGAVCNDFEKYGYCDRLTKNPPCWQHR